MVGERANIIAECVRQRENNIFGFLHDVHASCVSIVEHSQLLLAG